ncbi:flagellar hook protein FlgE [Geosporobacter subterraneus DSM 17957]|uniref:Flagellar hook protein FlgE n=1 Tax=Geosporobacter subterraneus DSM 17957 TaxID=1121919 RepID=A0A1M6E4R0_9FIRM|nr:flagellar hook protein FlgE [Geosporobacter subterraneus]SHI80258.1 flagellar hook protein FlgE [Geosporobacter subterraneus DSM 17957]
MMRSMYSGVSGLRVHQTKMDVIGNNIANVNTVGFKGSKVTFQEVFSQTIRGAGSPQGGRGGTNPQQIGLGVNVASINVIHTKGATMTTNVPTDVMIDGSGFFVVTNDVNFQNKFYTRAGSFVEDKLGFIVDPNGFKVLGYNENNEVRPVQINRSATVVGTATGDREINADTPPNPALNKSGIQIKGNINFGDDTYDATKDNYSTTVDVFDSLGRVHTIRVDFKDRIDGAGVSYRKLTFNGADADPADVYVKFDASGNYIGLFEGSVAADGTFSETGSVVGKLTIANIPGANDISFTINDSVFMDDNGKPLLTHFSGASDAKGVSLTGNSAGVLDNWSISSKGEVIGNFTNGERKILATLMLADFDNPSGMQKIGNNLFIETPNSGTAKYGTPASGSLGALNPGALEMSNVDLSQEFTDMITTQRGFQANSRIITTTDEMLQELVNLKR